jgi:hypothetical protein
MSFDDCFGSEHPDAREERERPAISDELCGLLRGRVATRYYERPQVTDAVARRILSRTHEPPA